MTKGVYSGDLQADTVTAPPDKEGDKDFHEWGQSVSVFENLISKWSDPGQMVLDPFLGGGAAAVAAASLKRRFFGSDVDAGHVETSRRRVFGGWE
jgi:hypothetical protein